MFRFKTIKLQLFLSTLSLRRATLWACPAGSAYLFLSTLSLRRATAREESDQRHSLDFYPRSPCGERPSRRYPAILGRAISIHALLAESDNKISAIRITRENFYPRSPCGERLMHALKLASAVLFLSTLSLRRATTWTRGSRITYVISIHALLAESDRKGTRQCFLSSISIHALLAESDNCHLIPNSGTFYFYPRSPCGERPHCFV